MNILYIGSSGPLSLLPFKRLLACGFHISAVGVWHPTVFPRKMLALENETLAQAAFQRDIPLVDMSKPVDELVESCSSLAINLILISCYARRLPDQLIKLPAIGCFNMHPSLLPGFRGPEPVFWQMRENARLGVSWHQVVTAFDAGDLLAQQPVELEDGLSYAQINLTLAKQGAELLTEMLQQLSRNTPRRQPQDPKLAHYQTKPQPQDFRLDCTWSVRHAFNFMRATHTFAKPYAYLAPSPGPQEFLLHEAIGFEICNPPRTVKRENDLLHLPFKDGILMTTYAHDSHPGHDQ